MAHNSSRRDEPRLRKMTSLYLLRPGALLLLCRSGSRVVQDGYWCGVGGHFEPAEMEQPRACVLRELGEETGWGEGDLRDLTLRYITLRQVPGEVRENYYFFASLQMPDRPLPPCPEGRLSWVPLPQVLALDMPVTAKSVLRHYLERGGEDTGLYGGIATGAGMAFAPLEIF